MELNTDQRTAVIDLLSVEMIGTIKEDMKSDDYSLIDAMITGNGVKQLNELSDTELISELKNVFTTTIDIDTHMNFDASLCNEDTMNYIDEIRLITNQFSTETN